MILNRFVLYNGNRPRLLDPRLSEALSWASHALSDVQIFRMKGISKRIRTAIPIGMKQRIRPLYHRALIWIDSLSPRKGRMLPPKNLAARIGDQDYTQVGEVIKYLLIEFAGLLPDHAILDVGCGAGRAAVPLLDYLTPPAGRYVGFDIMADAILWCRRNIAAQHPNFTFFHADIYNGAYNPTGKIKGREYRFPFDNNVFDVVLLASVFTHMLPREHENYLAEISRVLKPGGGALITYFLIDQTARQLISEGKAKYDFQVEIEPACYAADPEIPESVVAYEEEQLRSLYAGHGLDIQEPIRYGTWSSRAGFPSLQDILLAVKQGSSG